MTIIMMIVLIESFFTCKNRSSENSKTGVKQPSGLKNYLDEEHKQVNEDVG